MKQSHPRLYLKKWWIFSHVFTSSFRRERRFFPELFCFPHPQRSWKKNFAFLHSKVPQSLGKSRWLGGHPSKCGENVRNPVPKKCPDHSDSAIIGKICPDIVSGWWLEITRKAVVIFVLGTLVLCRNWESDDQPLLGSGMMLLLAPPGHLTAKGNWTMSMVSCVWCRKPPNQLQTRQTFRQQKHQAKKNITKANIITKATKHLTNWAPSETKKHLLLKWRLKKHLGQTKMPRDLSKNRSGHFQRLRNSNSNWNTWIFFEGVPQGDFLRIRSHGMNHHEKPAFGRRFLAHFFQASFTSKPTVMIFKNLLEFGRNFQIKTPPRATGMCNERQSGVGLSRF